LLLAQNRYLASIDRSNQDAAKAALAELERQIARVKAADLETAKPEELPMGVPASWWLSQREYAPTEVAKQVAKPTLLLQGDRDFQVTANLRMLPGLNHLFQVGEGTPSPQEYAKPGHMSGAVVSTIADWVLAL
jgi:alpha-beta hydrolase superfamily lysophospholipase